MARSQLSIEVNLRRRTPPVRFFHGGSFRGTEEENTSQLRHKTFAVLLRAAPPSAPTAQTLINGGERGLGVTVNSGRGKERCESLEEKLVCLPLLPLLHRELLQMRFRTEKERGNGQRVSFVFTEGNKVRRKTLFFCPVGFRGRNYSRPPGFREKTTLRYVLHALLHTYSTVRA